MSSSLAVCFTVIAMVSGTGCVDEDVPESPDGLGITVALVSGSGKLSLEVGESVSFAVSTNAQPPYVTHWFTSDPNRLSVDQSGTVRGLGAGQASVLVVLEFSDGKEAQGRADLTVTQ